MGVEASGLLIKLENYFTSYLKKFNTMGDNVSFKVFLKTGEEQEEEVRRFVIDKGASTSYDYLVGKLEVVFPQIKTSTFSIHWTDEDGDNVTITHAAAADAAKASADASAAFNAAFEGVNLSGSEDYLKNVGNFVAAALDPLGIDVKIDI